MSALACLIPEPVEVDLREDDLAFWAMVTFRVALARPFDAVRVLRVRLLLTATDLDWWAADACRDPLRDVGGARYFVRIPKARSAGPVPSPSEDAARVSTRCLPRSVDPVAVPSSTTPTLYPPAQEQRS